MRDLLRAEIDAPWWTAVLVIGALLVCALAVLSPGLGVVWAALLLGFGTGLAVRSSSRRRLHRVRVARSEDGVHRVLVLANQALASPSLLTEVERRCQGGRGEVLIVAPALDTSRAARWASDVDAAIEAAEARLEVSLRAARAMGLRASGRVGDSDPSAALEDALSTFAADEIVIWTHTPDRSPWVEHGVVQRAREEVELPITHVVLDAESEIAGHEQ